MSFRLNASLLAGACVAAAIAFVFLIPRDATWKSDPGDQMYDNASNWSSGAVPGGTAYFGASSRSELTFRRGYIPRYVYPNDWFASRYGWISVEGWTFNQGAADYRFKIGPASYPINETPRVRCTGERIRFTGSGIVVHGGSVSLVNDSCLAFVGKSTAGTAPIVNNKWLEFFDGGSAGRSSIVNNNVLRFVNASAGDASITNNDEMEFRGESTAASSAIINNGRIWFSESSTARGATIDNAAPSSTVILDRARVSLGAIAGPGEINLGRAELAVGSNDQSMTISGVIADWPWGERNGSLTMIGRGTLTLTGTNTYQGMTVVDRGTLAVNGFNASSRLTKVNWGATLTGTGIVGHAQVNTQGTLAPGAAGTPGSSINIAGSLAFQAGAIFALHIDPTAAAFAKVTAQAMLQGATVNVLFGPGEYVERKYRILEADGGVSGTFAPIVAMNTRPAGLKVELSYDDRNVYLALVPIRPVEH